MREFDTDIKIERYYNHDGEQLTFYQKVHIKTHRLRKEEFRGVSQIMDWGARFKSGSFLYGKYKRGIKESNVFSLC